MPVLHQLKFLLQVSRPGLWFPTLWLYLLPTSQMEVWDSTHFWLGFAYATFPINFLIYGWNDIVDQATDQANIRKGNFLFGAKGNSAQLQALPNYLIVVQLLTYPIFIYLAGWKMLWIFLALLLVCFLYNLPEKGLRAMPPLELLCQFAYLLIVLFSVWLNDTPMPSWETFVYLSLFCVQSQLIGEVMDIEPDTSAGRSTTATRLGMKGTKLLIICVVAIEAALLFLVFEDYIFGGMLLFALGWLLLDLFLIFRTQTYTLFQMKLFGWGSNGIAIVSMIYVWLTGCLL